jgi:hypothetical protein
MLVGNIEWELGEYCRFGLKREGCKTGVEKMFKTTMSPENRHCFNLWSYRQGSGKGVYIHCSVCCAPHLHGTLAITSTRESPKDWGIE